MGSSNSKPEKNEALRLCKVRMRFIKQAVDSRYALSAAHLAYVQSLRSVGSALRRFAEADISIESSLSTSEPDKTPSLSSYASPSPSRYVEHTGSPLPDGSPISPRFSNISYMKATGKTAVTVKMDPSLSHFVDDESLTFSLPPPPPPPEIDSSWDFFGPADLLGTSGLPNGQHGYATNSSSLGNFRNLREEVIPADEADVRCGKIHPLECKDGCDFLGINNKIGDKLVKCDATSNTFAEAPSSQSVKDGTLKSHQNGASGYETSADIASSKQSSSKIEKTELEKASTEREDPSEFITHRAKDFLTSIKDIENRFSRAAESGNEVSRMLEANKIRLSSYLEKIGRSPPAFLSAIHLSCCRNGSVLDHEPTQHVTKVITWNRSISSLSSSSRNPLTSAIKDDGDSSSDFVEEFCMISGSHSSTLERLYAWERKLHDEVKACESIRKEYDRKCYQLRHQFARDMNAQVIDKTRAIVKDLHSQVQVSICAVDSISKRIEKLRDEELFPQILELMQGLIRMWKAMLACHHTQYITISLAYHAKTATVARRSESYRNVLIHLQNEMDCFVSSFAMWVDALKAYVEALNAWLQNCILQPQEKSRGRKATFSPRRAIAPPIFVLCRDWSAGIKSLPSEELSGSIKSMLSELHATFIESKQVEQVLEEPNSSGKTGGKEDEKCEGCPNLGSLQTGLMKIFDYLTKFSEASLKMYEDMKHSSEVAHAAYANGWMRIIS